MVEETSSASAPQPTAQSVKESTKQSQSEQASVKKRRPWKWVNFAKKKETPASTKHLFVAGNGNLLERKSMSGTYIKVNVKHIIHGTESPDGPPASLIVLEHCFHPSPKGVALGDVKLRYTFAIPSEAKKSELPEGAGEASRRSEIEVVRISPDKRVAFDETVVETTTRQGARWSTNLGIGSRDVATVGGGFVWETQNTFKTHFSGRINPLIRYSAQRQQWVKMAVPDEFIPKDQAMWHIAENPESKSGVPYTFIIVVLVKRPADMVEEAFSVFLEVDAAVDKVQRATNKMKKMARFGKVAGQLVFFDPKVTDIGRPWEKRKLPDDIDPTKLGSEEVWEKVVGAFKMLGRKEYKFSSDMPVLDEEED